MITTAEPTVAEPIAYNVMERLNKKAEATMNENSKLKQPETKQPETVAEVVKLATEKKEETVVPVEEHNEFVQTQEKIKEEKKELETKKVEAKVEKLEKEFEKVKTEPNWWDENKEEISLKQPANEHKIVTDYQAKAKAFDEMLSDPLVEAIVTAKKNGKDPLTIIKDLQPLDVNSISEETLYEMSLKNEGLKEDEISTEMEAFNALTPLAKKRTVKEFRQELSKKDSEKLSKYIVDNRQNLQNMDKIAERYNEEKNQFFDTLKDKEYMGIKITPSIASEVEKMMDTGISLFKEDGSFDVKKAFDLHLWNSQKSLIMKNAVSKAKSEGREEIIKEYARPSREDGSLKIIPEQVNGNEKDVTHFRQSLRS